MIPDSREARAIPRHSTVPALALRVHPANASTAVWERVSRSRNWMQTSQRPERNLLEGVFEPPGGSNPIV